MDARKEGWVKWQWSEAGQHNRARGLCKAHHPVSQYISASRRLLCCSVSLKKHPFGEQGSLRTRNMQITESLAHKQVSQKQNEDKSRCVTLDYGPIQNICIKFKTTPTWLPVPRKWASHLTSGFPITSLAFAWLRVQTPTSNSERANWWKDFHIQRTVLHCDPEKTLSLPFWSLYCF